MTTTQIRKHKKKKKQEERVRLIPGAILRRDKGGGQSQMQGGQEEVLESGNPTVFLNLQYKAGPHTPKAEITAKKTKQHLKQVPDLLDISLSRIKYTVCVVLSASMS